MVGTHLQISFVLALNSVQRYRKSTGEAVFTLFQLCNQSCKAVLHINSG